MEPNLDRLIEWGSRGTLFYGFSDTWLSKFEAAKALGNRIAGNSKSVRPRIALSTLDPESFCALFLAFCLKELDLFFFSPDWGERERREAIAIATPDWIVSDFSRDRFRDLKMKEPSDPSAAIKPGLRVMIPTGGTSGKVKFVIHRWSTLSASVYGFQAYFDADAIHSHCVLPLYHVSGFMQLLRSLLTVGKIAFGSLGNFEVSHATLFAGGKENRFLSLVPTQLERLLINDSNLPLLREYTAIFIGGGPASSQLLNRARALELPLAPTYGMSETAAMVATLKPRDFLKGREGQGRPLAHVRLEIVGDSGVALAPGQQGRIRIQAKSLFRGYFGEEEGLRKSLVAPDRGVMSPEGMLMVIDRVDNVIVSGGEKIDLGQVERVIEETGWVTDVVAFGVDDPEWGSKLCLGYVPNERFRSERELLDSIREELAPFKVPKACLRLKSLPRNKAGKIVVESLVNWIKEGRRELNNP